MIKPASLWALFKGCQDSTWLGNICRALGGQDVDLDFGQKQMVDVISRDNGWMDESVEAKREKWRVKKSRQRSREAVAELDQIEAEADMGEIGDKRRNVPLCLPNGGKVPCPPSSDTLPPSLPSSTHMVCAKSRAPARACEGGGRQDVPSLADVVSTATSVMGVPEWYAEWWHREMESRDWRKTDGSLVGHGNWRPCLKSWWNRTTPDELDRLRLEYKAQAKKREAKERRYGAADWQLCRERCAKWREGCGCRAGMVVPPQMRESPIPPEECPGYENLAQADGRRA